MKVQDIMTREVRCCELGTNLAAASELMWSGDCGVLPVTDDGKLQGSSPTVISALRLEHETGLLGTWPYRKSPRVRSKPARRDADVHTAMAPVRRAKVRRLPVVDDGRIEGILALNDPIEAVDRKHGDIDYEEVMSTIKALSEQRTHKRPAASVAPATFPPIPVAVA